MLHRLAHENIGHLCCLLLQLRMLHAHDLLDTDHTSVSHACLSCFWVYHKYCPLCPCILQVSSDDEAAKASERSNRQLEAAVMQQRRAALQQQEESLHQQLAALPPEQQQLAQYHQHHLRLQLQRQQEEGRSGRGRGRGRGRKNGSSRTGRLSAGVHDQQSQQLRRAPDVGEAAAAAEPEPGLRMAMVETERDRLIRCGLLTPFDKLEGFDMRVQGAAATEQQQQQAAEKPLPQQQQQQQQQQQHEIGPAARVDSGTQAAARVSAAVDEQWALLTRNAVPANANPAAAPVPADLADIAHQVGRGGLPLSDLLAKAAQQTLEVGVTNRHRAILMEPVEVRGDPSSFQGLHK